jgi:hypothetical protein
MRQRPAAQDRTHRPPVRKFLFRGEADGGFGVLLDGTPFPAKLMEHSPNTQGITQTKGVRTLLRQGHRLLAPRQPLVRIAQVPQRPGSNAMANHTRVLPVEERMGAVLLGVVERDPLRHVRVRRGWRSQEGQCCP